MFDQTAPTQNLQIQVDTLFNYKTCLSSDQKELCANIFYRVVSFQSKHGLNTPRNLVYNFFKESKLENKAIIIAFDLLPDSEASAQVMRDQYVVNNELYKQYQIQLNQIVNQPIQTQNQQCFSIAKNQLVVEKAQQYINFLFFEELYQDFMLVDNTQINEIASKILALLQQRPVCSNDSIYINVFSQSSVTVQQGYMIIQLFVNLVKLKQCLGLEISQYNNTSLYSPEIGYKVNILKKRLQKFMSCYQNEIVQSIAINQSSNNEQHCKAMVDVQTTDSPQYQDNQNVAIIEQQNSFASPSQHPFLPQQNLNYTSTPEQDNQIGSNLISSQVNQQHNESIYPTTQEQILGQNYQNNFEQQADINIQQTEQPLPMQQEDNQQMIAQDIKSHNIQNTANLQPQKRQKNIEQYEYKDLLAFSNAHMKVLKENSLHGETLMITQKQQNKNDFDSTAIQSTKQNQESSIDNNNIINNMDTTVSSLTTSAVQSQNAITPLENGHQIINQDNNEAVYNTEKLEEDQNQLITAINDLNERSFWVFICDQIIKYDGFGGSDDDIDKETIYQEDVAINYAKLSKEIQNNIKDKTQEELKLSEDLFNRFYNKLESMTSKQEIPAWLIDKIRLKLKNCHYREDWEKSVLNHIYNFIQLQQFELKNGKGLEQNQKQKIQLPSDDVLKKIIENEYQKLQKQNEGNSDLAFYQEIVPEQKIDQMAQIKILQAYQTYYNQEKYLHDQIKSKQQAIKAKKQQLYQISDQYTKQTEDEWLLLYNAYTSMVSKLHGQLYEELDETDALQKEIKEIQHQLKIIEIKKKCEEAINKKWEVFEKEIDIIQAKYQNELINIAK